MLNKILNNIQIRVCLNCGSFFVRSSGLCDYCHKKLETIACHEDVLWLEKVQVQGESIKSFSLFHWCPDVNRPLSCLIKNLKGAEERTAWRHYAKDFIRRRVITEELNQPILFVPCPNTERKKDHAYLFAESLSKNFGTSPSCILTKSGEVPINSQKNLNKKGRLDVRLALDENFTKMDLNKYKIVFVDDVVTTGSTAIAAYIALRRPTQFEVWSLAFRLLR